MILTRPFVFTDQEPHAVTEWDLTHMHGGDRQRFCCYLCGHQFELGDTWRWVYIPNRVNLIVCSGCDGDDVTERWITVFDQAMTIANRLGWL